MSRLIKPPPPNVPIADRSGTITLAWDLFFRALVERTGGLEAPTNNELASRPIPMLMDEGGGDDVMFVPGPQGPPGQATVSVVMLFDESVVDDVVFIPR
jgi:hypothetical protein